MVTPVTTWTEMEKLLGLDWNPSMDHSCNLRVERAVSQHPGFCFTTVKLTNIFVATSIFSDGVTSFFSHSSLADGILQEDSSPVSVLL